MAAPTLTHTGQRLYDSVAPLTFDDENQEYALMHFCHAAASMVDEIADLSRDSTDGDPGYSGLFDVDAVAEDYLPYIAQFIGVTVPDYLSDEQKRLRIHETGGFQRGTPAAIAGAARQYLTGDKTVFLVERHGGAYLLTVATYNSETPNPDLTEAALIAQIPGGILFNYSLIDPGTFDELRDSHTDFDDVTSTYVSFDEVLADPTKT